MELLKKKPFKPTFSMTMDVTRVYNQLLRNNVHIYIETERRNKQAIVIFSVKYKTMPERESTKYAVTLLMIRTSRMTFFFTFSII